MNDTKTPGDSLQEEITRVRNIQKIYDSLPDNVGVFASKLMEASIQRAIKALAKNNPVQCLFMCRELEQFKE